MQRKDFGNDLGTHLGGALAVALAVTLLGTDAQAAAGVMRRPAKDERADASIASVSSASVSSASARTSKGHRRVGAGRVALGSRQRVGDDGNVPRRAMLASVDTYTFSSSLVADTAPDERVDDATSNATPSSAAERSTVELHGRGGFVRRSLGFQQDLYNRLRSLQANLLVYRLDAAAYPAIGALPFGGNIGLIGGYERAFSGTVHDANFPDAYAASHYEWYAGLRSQHPVRGHLVGFDLALGHLASGLQDGNGASGTPDVSYSDVRASLDTTLNFGRITASGAVGFRVPLGYGEMSDADWFPHIGGYGLESRVGGSYLVAPGISAELSMSWRHFVLEMNSQPEDGAEGVAEVAGGAVDSYLGAYAGFCFAL